MNYANTMSSFCCSLNYIWKTLGKGMIINYLRGMGWSVFYNVNVFTTALSSECHELSPQFVHMKFQVVNAIIY